MDHIRKLLLQTGWSCDDLISKINEFKLQESSSDEQFKCSEEPISNSNGNTSKIYDTNNVLPRVSLMEVENDHSYTCRMDTKNTNYEMQKKIHQLERKRFYAAHIKKYLEYKQKKYVRKVYLPRKIKRRYKLQRKYATTDRKMLICKYKSKEVVRNEIMYQLELLRSKRKLGITSNIKQTPISDTIFLKKRYSGDKVREPTTSGCNRNSYKEFCGTSNNNQDRQSHYSNTIEEKVRKEKFNRDFYSIKPTKTNDITKIKGWKNKKFLTSNKINMGNNESNPRLTDASYQDNTDENKTVAAAKTDAKSAFASTNLDGFLHESANLHISFQIPTLNSGNHKPTVNINRGESQVKPDKSASSLIHNKDNERLQVERIDTLNLYKPRTVGQKRRIWKLKTDNRLKKRIEEVARPRTLAEKRRMLDYDMEVKNRLKSNDGSCFDSDQKYSYILHRGRKLKIRTKEVNGIIAHVKSRYGKRDYIYVPKKVRQQKNKPSIFSTTPVTQSKVVKYRPGPLCKKALLQENNKNWTSEIKMLPKVYLQVTPKLNKPIWPRIRHLLPQYDFEITDERVDFALTVLSPRSNSKSFTFPVPYANKQECLLLRRKIQLNEDIPVRKIVDSEDEKTVEETVENIISKMLDYVEIKSISEEVITDDVTEKIMKEEHANINDQQNNTSKKRKTKQSKTNYELKRLNVKVIEVNLEDKGEIDHCKKDYCQLGCVCKSLSTTSSLVSNHCGVPDCMFECKCNYEKKSKGNLKVTLPIGTDLLSEGAVNRLEVEAKKNLAKVEKEFTQTVIQANNQTIVVGGCTNRQRRVTKLPKKYTDYIEDPDGLITAVPVPEDDIDENEDVNDKLKNWKPVPCVIFMNKLKLKQVIPYCMVHLLHDCHCDYKAVFDAKKDAVKEEMPITKPEIFKNTENKEESIDFCLNKLDPIIDIDITGSSARTKGLPTNYYLVRNRTEKFVSSRRRRLDKMYRHYMESEDKLKDTKESDYVNVQDIDEPQKVNVASISTEVHTKRRRKQKLLVRRDTSPDLQRKFVSLSPENAIQRRKKYKKHNSNNQLQSPTLPPPAASIEKEADQSKPALSQEQLKLTSEKTLDARERIAKFDQIFQTISDPVGSNLFTPSMVIQEKLNEILGKNIGTDAQFRFIPWDILVKKYETNSLQLWYSTFFKKPRIIATDNRTIPKHFVNVRSYEKIPNKNIIKADLIRWLVTRNVPSTNCKENIFVIVQLTKTHCELCGLWEKKQSNNSDKMILISQPSDTTNSPENKMYSIVKKIMFSKCKFSKQTLLEIKLSEELKNESTLSAYLPQISSSSKWRMIRLNSDFSVLSLHRNKYAIKYSDLQKVMKMAKETSYTIVLKTPEVETNYPHPDFGIYASPECEDAVFVGPYYMHEDHDITTLRYANRELIRTDLFNKMKGQKPVCNSVWLAQLSTTTSNVENLQTIDLTDYGSDSEPQKASQPQELNINRSLLKPSNLQTVVMNKRRKKCKRIALITCNDILLYESRATDYTVPEDFYNYLPQEVDPNESYNGVNMCFVPNVPNIGYIIGHELMNGIILRWPSMRYAVNFADVKDAVSFLERELNTYFMKKPGFEISIQVLSEFNPTEIEKFDAEIMLKGYFIVSSKGVVPLLNIDNFVLKNFSMTMADIEGLAEKRAQRMIFDKSLELARKLFPPAKLGKPRSSNAIIDLIIEEIKQQEQLEHKLLVQQGKLTERKHSLRTNCTSIIKELTPLVNSKMQNAMKRILAFNNTALEDKSNVKSTSTDVICIDGDSDEDTKHKRVVETFVQPNPPIPKITVKRIQDLREPTTTSNNTKVVNIKSVSILKTKSPSSDCNTSVNSDNLINFPPAEISRQQTIRSGTNPGKCRTVTIKKSLLQKKCSKFVIKTSTGKYMTIRAEDLKELPVKRLQPIAPNDPMIPKLNLAPTKRILMPKSNGFLKVNFRDKPTFNQKIITSNVIENGVASANGQHSYQSSSKQI